MKMKKIICMLLCFVVIVGMAGCGNDGGVDGYIENGQSGVEDALQVGIKENSGSENADTAKNDVQSGDLRENGFNDNASEVEETGSYDGAPQREDDIYIDLTSLSATMVYSEVYNIMYEPEQYIGKTIKMQGAFTVYHDESTGKDYFACVIQDALACCAQGIEFTMADDYSYPDDYPAEGETITVIGVFDTYMEGGYTYCTLRNAHFV